MDWYGNDNVFLFMIKIEMTSARADVYKTRFFQSFYNFLTSYSGEFRHKLAFASLTGISSGIGLLRSFKVSIYPEIAS